MQFITDLARTLYDEFSKNFLHEDAIDVPVTRRLHITPIFLHEETGNDRMGFVTLTQDEEVFSIWDERLKKKIIGNGENHSPLIEIDCGGIETSAEKAHRATKGFWCHDNVMVKIGSHGGISFITHPMRSVVIHTLQRCDDLLNGLTPLTFWEFERFPQRKLKIKK